MNTKFIKILLTEKTFNNIRNGRYFFDNKYTHTVFYLETSNFADVIMDEEEYELIKANGFNFIKLKNEYYNKWEEELVYAYTPGMWKNMYYSMKIRVEASA